MDKRNGYVTIGDSKIYYEQSGQGEPIIFVHADTLDHRQWKRQVDYFSKNYRVIVYDIRGFGQSDIPGKTAYSFSEDLHILMSALKIDNAHLIGLSLGGSIAIDFALTHPEKVRSLILADSGINGDGFSHKFIDDIHTIECLAKTGKTKKAKQTWTNMEIFDFSRNNPDVWKSVLQMVNNTSCYRWYGKNQPVKISPPAIERLSEIKIPTLIIVGKDDIEDFQKKAQSLNEKIKGSTLVTIPNAGHLSNMDNPDSFNMTVNTFLISL